MHRTHPVSLRAVPPPALPRTQPPISLLSGSAKSAPSRALAALVALLAALAAACSGHHKPATAPQPQPGAQERGIASWYGPKFNGHRTASGERYDMRALTAAHPSLP
ncbi:MAG TPA: septal ring lytic transglycosylase RlpA family protein, partial [Thermoanaerobaculia bacterium]